MATLRLQPGNPADFTDQELIELRDVLSGELSDDNVELDLRRETGGYGEFAYAVIELVIVAGELAGAGVAVATAVEWAKRQRRRIRADPSKTRPQMVRFYDANGEVLTEVLVEDSTE